MKAERENRVGVVKWANQIDNFKRISRLIYGQGEGLSVHLHECEKISPAFKLSTVQIARLGRMVSNFQQNAKYKMQNGNKIKIV
jgi:hypothetical protein